MQVGINEGFISEVIGFDKTIEYLSKVGFNTIDFNFYNRNTLFENSNYLDIAKEMKNTCIKNNISISQMHANWFRFDDPIDEIIYKNKMNLRAIEVAAEMNCQCVVVHATKFTGYYRDNKIFEQANIYNKQLLKEYVDYAKKFNIKIAIENMFGYETNTVLPAQTIFSTASQMNEYISELGNNCVACLDTGHAFVANQDIPRMIKELGDNLQVLHIHDAIMTEDAHLVPGLGKIDWDSFIKAIAKSNYNKTLSLELFVNSSVGILDYVKYAYLVVNNLREKIEEERK